uniref:Uncharacterized protein n=1 Tax=Podoviridae sp. ct8Lf7 TaxID=2827723 RepID=A0A8S5S1D6_9CAUD|nr:MAG TPA: hypothetical protein [Podoviridae sp. ct8Lf7]
MDKLVFNCFTNSGVYFTSVTNLLLSSISTMLSVVIPETTIKGANLE